MTSGDSFQVGAKKCAFWSTGRRNFAAIYLQLEEEDQTTVFRALPEMKMTAERRGERDVQRSAETSTRRNIIRQRALVQTNLRNLGWCRRASFAPSWSKRWYKNAWKAPWKNTRTEISFVNTSWESLSQSRLSKLRQVRHQKPGIDLRNSRLHLWNFDHWNSVPKGAGDICHRQQLATLKTRFPCSTPKHGWKLNQAQQLWGKNAQELRY